MLFTFMITGHKMVAKFILQAGKERYSKARVIVSPANEIWGDEPYTLQPGMCGQEGDYIHLTPNYIKSSMPNKCRSNSFVNI